LLVYQQTPGSWNTTEVEIANPLSIYPRFKPRRSLFYAENLGPDTVMVETDKGIVGFGYGGPGTSFVVERQLGKLLAEEDPFQLERLWDIMWRGTLYYGRKGIAIHAISPVDNALWEIVGKALKTPVYRFLEGSVKERVPCYCTGNNIEQAIQFGFKKLELAIPHGPADGLTLGDGLRAYSLWGDLAYQLAVPEATAGSRTATGSKSPRRRDDPRAVRRRADAHHDRQGFGLPPQGQNPNWRLSGIVGSLLL
jgi:L-alanine-DL-glutamate epimerase-like enolase superfamily enzyme